MKTTAVVLAAGQGTRMHSKLPKILHPLLGRPMALYALEAAQSATGRFPTAIIGHEADIVRRELGNAANFVLQQPQLGTGHAVQQAEAHLRGKTDLVLVTTADMPLLTADTLGKLIQAQGAHHGPMSLLTILADDPRGFGRVIRDENGAVKAVIEEAHATTVQLGIRELNTSVYCFSANWLWTALRRVPVSPKGEYYLTDVVGIAVADGLPVQAIVMEDAAEAIGINNRLHLAEAEALMRQRINEKWMLSGVTLVDPACTYIEPGVNIGQDTTIWPNTYLRGGTVIGENCTIGPNTILQDTHTGSGCRITTSVVEYATLEDNVDVGPFAHLRKNAHLAQGVHMGNFGEVKNAYLGPGTKMGHFSYIGDATIGNDVNIGAGTITCNYDGERKNHTDIGAGAFIGSDTMLVAPVKIGDRAKTGAGAIVTKDVPDDSLAVGMPARSIRKFSPSKDA